MVSHIGFDQFNLNIKKTTVRSETFTHPLFNLIMRWQTFQKLGKGFPHLGVRNTLLRTHSGDGIIRSRRRRGEINSWLKAVVLLITARWRVTAWRQTQSILSDLQTNTHVKQPRKLNGKKQCKKRLREIPAKVRELPGERKKGPNNGKITNPKDIALTKWFLRKDEDRNTPDSQQIWKGSKQNVYRRGFREKRQEKNLLCFYKPGNKKSTTMSMGSQKFTIQRLRFDLELRKALK